METCIFCKIVKGEAPSFKIYEDEKFLAFLDTFPATEGYTLVIPKEHYRYVWDVPNIGEYFEVCRKIAKHFQKVTENDAVYSMILGEEIPHAHVRLFPGNEDISKELHKFVAKTKTPNRISDEDGERIKDKLKITN
jgi:histidine triad (HIT) family protein